MLLSPALSNSQDIPKTTASSIHDELYRGSIYQQLKKDLGYRMKGMNIMDYDSLRTIVLKEDDDTVNTLSRIYKNHEDYKKRLSEKDKSLLKDFDPLKLPKTELEAYIKAAPWKLNSGNNISEQDRLVIFAMKHHGLLSHYVYSLDYFAKFNPQIDTKNPDNIEKWYDITPEKRRILTLGYTDLNRALEELPLDLRRDYKGFNPNNLPDEELQKAKNKAFWSLKSQDKPYTESQRFTLFYLLSN